MHPTVRFAEPDHHREASAGGPATATVLFRLPKISAGSAGADSAATYARHGFSPPLSPQDPSSYWKYPLPSKSFRVYVGPPLRQTDAAAAASQPASRGSGSGGRGPAEADPALSPDRLQRSRTEPVLTSSHGGPPLTAPYLTSRALISLRRRQPHQPPPPQLLHREATMTGDEAERLRWTMTTQRHWQVDRKGQQRNQGPFSREFTVHVTAPSTWLRMKWGRRLPQPEPRPPPAEQASYLYTKQAFGHQQPGD